jgi:hypothetical protein
MSEANSPSKAVLVAKLTENGFAYPDAILHARTVAKLGLPVACGMLMMETGGGANIYGHDTDRFGRCPGYGWGEVTQANYAAFKHLRDTQGRSNGVGPCQLTSPELQDEADEAGGCWLPAHNMGVGFHTLHDLIARYGLIDGCAAYNGGPGGRHATVAQTYAHHLIALAEHYKSIGLGTVVGVW